MCLGVETAGAVSATVCLRPAGDENDDQFPTGSHCACRSCFCIANIRIGADPDVYRRLRARADATVSLDELEMDLPAKERGNEAFGLEWARTILTEVLRRMELDCRTPHRNELNRYQIWETFRLRLLQPILEGAEPMGYEELVSKLGIASPFAAQNLLATAKRIFSRHLNAVISEYEGQRSVIPLFHDQIRNGGPVTITAPEMTRFLLSLDDAVDNVFAALKDARRGETYIPRAPSATVIDIARALIGSRDVALKTVGIRPGEKMHEILISEEEVHHCVRRGGYYAIQPMLPELRQGESQESNALEKEHSSGDEVLDRAGTTALLKKHQLMVEDADLGDRPELLR